jgi:hypothetical protein
VLKPPAEDAPKGPNWGKAVVQRGGKSKSAGILVPVAAGLAALVVIPLAILSFAPGKPKGKPEEVLKEYYALEFSGAFDKQFALFSKRQRELLGPAGDYAKKRKEDREAGAKRRAQAQAQAAEASGEEQAPDDAPSLQELKILEQKTLSAEAMSYVTRGGYQEQWLFELTAEDRLWKIGEARRLSLVPVVPRKIVRAVPESETPAAKPAGIQDMKEQALDMLEKAHASGKVSDEDYEMKKKKIESV